MRAATLLVLLLAASADYARSRIASAATIIVDSTLDLAVADGAVTLREAITAANINAVVNEAPAGDPGQDTIRFATRLGGTITLGGAELIIAESLAIEGPGADQLAVSGNDASRVFRLENVGSVTISGLTVTRGNSGSQRGGGILNVRTVGDLSGGSVLILDRVTLVDNTAPTVGNEGGSRQLVCKS